MTRGPRSKVLDAPTGFVPGPGAYQVGEELKDYRGIYKNMGKKKKTKKRKDGDEFADQDQMDA